MNIFILCAGKGTRFESIYPKPLNLINGKPMIYHTIKSLNLEKVQDYKFIQKIDTRSVPRYQSRDR